MPVFPPTGHIFDGQTRAGEAQNLWFGGVIAHHLHVKEYCGAEFFHSHIPNL